MSLPDSTSTSIPATTSISTSSIPPRAPPTPPPDSPSPVHSSPRTNNSADFPSISPSSPSQSQSQSTIMTTTASFPSPGLPTFASVVAAPSLSPLLPTSVSSPAWFPPFDREPAPMPTSPVTVSASTSPLVASFSSATLVDASPAFTAVSPSEHEHEAKGKDAALEEGEIREAEVLMKDLGLGLGLGLGVSTSSVSIGSKDPQPDDSPVLPAHPIAQSPPQSPPRAPVRPSIPLPPVDEEGPDFSPPATSASAAAAVPLPSTPPAASVPSTTSTPSAPPNSASSLLAPAHASVTTLPQTNVRAEPTQTPNVYINGLPPSFPEDQLFALAAPFGAVRSVRSFTRHVGDTETGYGFVLFETLAAAEKCINSLRRYRNLHPTFSKQIHKIPGTMYAHASSSAPHPSSTTSASPTQSAAPSHPLVPSASEHGGESASSLAAWEQETVSGSGSGADSTFKAKMERLADKASTNLYIEGLPLSIDDATLGALVSPYSIRSSRFFQTKLSTPPRIIAFVRLETRAAAEEIIERLHGRMVRGWNDPGSRISVRFADTSEQRELRRQERLAREGDQTGTQLSIAQATLLNLRGKDLHPRPSQQRIGMESDFDIDDLHSDMYAHSNSTFNADPHGYPASEFEVDYSRAPARYPLGHHQDLEYNLPPPQQQVPVHAQRLNPAMATLLESLQASAHNRDRDRDLYTQQDYRSALQLQQQLALSANNGTGGRSPYLPQGLGMGGAQTHHAAHAPHGGYTATEEFILRARSNSLPQPQFPGPMQKRRPTALDLTQARQRQEQQVHHELELEMEREGRAAAGANIGMGVRGYRAQAATLALPHHQQHGRTPVFGQHDAANMDEEDFHATHQVHGHGHRTQQQQQQQQFDTNHGLHTQQRISRTQQQPRAPSQTHDFARNTHLNQQISANQQQPHHYQHTSASASTHPRNMTLRASNNNNAMNTNHSNNHNSTTGIYERLTALNTNTRHNGASSYSGSHSHSHSHSHNMYPSMSEDQVSPSLISPALTYSSRSSASAAFSPTTPFFGSFDEGPPHMDGKGKKVNSRTATR
ncbi:hypothetical protein B0H11DRAFT_2316044 [Mycena galericulata]|nr:hypothetical protein B0H11DRAFT_2316044 [Mycena galericulata]